MDIVEYVMGVHEKNIYPRTFPGELHLPKDLVKSWHHIYKQGERIGCEYGQSLRINQGNLTVSNTVQGTDSSCNVPRTNDPWEFGDMHSHPTMSIGHVKGFSAHSVEDWQVFAHHLTKPVFIRFVATGDLLYAVAYRSTWSRYDPGTINIRLNKQVAYQTELFERYHPDKYEGLSDEEKLHLDDLMMQRRIIEMKMQTPGFGEQMMEKSLEHNFYLATFMRFAFYQGHRKEKGKLRLLEGNKGI